MDALKPWPHQEKAVVDVQALILGGVKRLCVTSPTGGGKTWIMCRVIEWAVEQGWKAILYTNRRLLIEQLCRVLKDHGINYGVRAANHYDQRELQVQISSLPTERSRVLKSQKWSVHGKGERVLAIIDEAHLNKADTARRILDMHLKDGGAYVGFTATPVDMAELYDQLYVAGKVSELRACKALVPAYHYGPDEPDMCGFKASVKTGEYTENDVRKAIMTKCIFGRVLEQWRTINADQRPTLLFGPGVDEAIWFAQQFEAQGIRAASIDGEGVWLDREYRKGKSARDYVLDSVRGGDIKILCNRFVLREGLDLPEVSHLILATVMGSLQTYLQSAGRGMRACAGKGSLTIQDHGGHYWRHGSVNVDREWNLSLTETMIAGTRAERFMEKKDQEPIRCPKCHAIRSSGSVCPQCGHESTRRSRNVIQLDGTLREYIGDIFKPRRIMSKPNTESLWTQCYFRAKRSKNGMTFSQARGLFFYENHYYPPQDLPLMPTSEYDWYRKVRDVPTDQLTRRYEPKPKPVETGLFK